MAHSIKHTSKRLLTGLMLASISITVVAAPSEEDNREGRRGPPQAAIDACVDLEQDAACTFEGRRGSLDGVCFAPRDDLPLACRPSKREKRRDSSRKPE